MTTLFVEETGRLTRFNTGFDLSSNTELSIIFCKPDGTSVTKTKTTNSVAMGTSTITVDVDGVSTTFTANQYVTYSVEADLIAAADAGEWSAQVMYTNTGETPNDNL